MSRPKRGMAGVERQAPSTRRRAAIAVAAILLAGGIVGVAVALLGEWRRTPSPPARPALEGVPGVASALAEAPDIGRLNGRWLRLDGGYVLEIRDAAGPGVVQATYFNPNPINIARAEASREGSALKLFVEFRAPGYPGSTYALRYDARRDHLEGVYFQAVLGQSFDVVFSRIK